MNTLFGNIMKNKGFTILTFLILGSLVFVGFYSLEARSLPNNLLVNGDFSNGTTDWWLAVNNGATATMSVSNGELCVDITNGSNEAWHVIVGQSNVTLAANMLYDIQFQARASTPYWMTFKTGQSTPPYTAYALAQRYLKAAPENFNHQYEQTVSDASSNFEMQIGGISSGQVCFDNVTLQTYLPPPTQTPVPTPTSGPTPIPDPMQQDLIKNGDFDGELTHWATIVSNDAAATVETINNEASVTIVDDGVNPWDIFLLQRYIPIIQGFDYTMYFDARAANNRAINIKIGQGESPYTGYGAQLFNLTTNMQSYSFDFHMDEPSDVCANLEFHLGGRGLDTVIIDNVRLETSVTAVPALLSAGGETPSNTTYPLRWHADRYNLLDVGTAVAMYPFYCKPPYKDVLAREYNILTPENALKFAPLHPQADVYDFSDSDALIEFAEEQDIRVHGHVLVWHNSIPTWLSDGNFTRNELINILHDHIDTVMGRYAGRIKMWDVVNEAIDDTTLGLRDSVWSTGIGTDYIDLAFQRARQTDPGAILVYNDYGHAGLGGKSDAIYNLVADMKGRGIPIDGVGIQMHVTDNPPDPADIAANMARYAVLGLDVYVTEIDVRLELPIDYADLANQAAVYKLMIQTCLAAPNCNQFTSWGFTDAHSWVPAFFPGYDAALIFDEAYMAKPAYHALIETLDRGTTPLTIAKTSPSTDVLLNWPGGDPGCTYRLLRSAIPYSTPAERTPVYIWSSGSTTYTDPGVITNGIPDYFYLVQSTGCDFWQATSNEVGVFKHTIVPGSP